MLEKILSSALFEGGGLRIVNQEYPRHFHINLNAFEKEKKLGNFFLETTTTVHIFTVFFIATTNNCSHTVLRVLEIFFHSFPMLIAVSWLHCCIKSWGGLCILCPPLLQSWGGQVHHVPPPATPLPTRTKALSICMIECNVIFTALRTTIETEK